MVINDIKNKNTKFLYNKFVYNINIIRIIFLLFIK